MTGFSPDEPAQGSALLDRFGTMLGARHILANADDMAPYLVEPRGLYHGRALCVLRPGSTEEVAAVLTLCNETRTPVVPQGGNTGLVGGQTPDASGRAIVISLERMRALRGIDLASNAMTVEAGMILAAAQAEAERAGRLFPLSLASEGSCTIGGNLAANAGGTSVIAYGNARDLTLGVEAVLADGRIYRGLSKLKKDNTGYDLKDLFIGSEGTLGIITAAVLKLFPRPAAVATAFIALPSPAAALALLDLAREKCGGQITAFELTPRIGLEFVLAHCARTRDPLPHAAPWYALLELSSQSPDGLDERLLQLLEHAADRGLICDAAVAASLDQRKTFWRLRDELSDAQRHEGGSIKHDVSVPVADIARFLTEVEAALAAAAPGARLVAFGHLGDGNIHCNVSQPIGADRAAFLDRWDEINAIVHGIVARYGGSISAEHGIGQLKRDLLPSVKDPVALELMRALKATLDPHGILNPGKVI
ncbi:FAD-binding oxidoreductase [Methylocella silvestris]|uniref:Hydroxyacid dehydrogenase n=1 Tax=Methylocella silvestris TaxID=199596 RepID=A0A2J7TEL5_METSI|nr:FAD-binding oxidoreductase [Methylocella silvestris]PNG25204.1 hydroxyacid dehydrogenase [Methylocella silvestris]